MPATHLWRTRARRNFHIMCDHTRSPSIWAMDSGISLSCILGRPDHPWLGRWIANILHFNQLFCCEPIFHLFIYVDERQDDTSCCHSMQFAGHNGKWQHSALATHGGFWIWMYGCIRRSNWQNLMRPPEVCNQFVPVWYWQLDVLSPVALIYMMNYWELFMN